MTDGVLLAEIPRDRLLQRYDTLIIDEAHERSLNVDFLLGYLKQILPQRPDLKIIITSATIDVERFARHFDGAPVIEVSGRGYPVEIRYRPPPEADADPVAAAVTTMLILAPLLGMMPQAVLASLVIVYSAGLIRPAEFVAIHRIRTMEFGWALAAFAGVLVFGTLKGILVAIILSLIGLASQAANSKVHVIGRKRGADVLRPLSPEHPDDETFDGLLILRPEGRLFFANAQQVSDQIRALVAQHQPRVLALDMSRVFDIEYSALQMLADGERRASEQGATVWLADLSPGAMECIKASGLADRLGRERLFFNARAVIRHYQENFLASNLQATNSEGPKVK